MNIDACSACSLRYGTNDINQLNECCYNTCASFIDGNQSDVINSECGENCRKCMLNAVGCKGKSPCEYMPEVPSIKLQQQRFKRCMMEKNNNTTEALKCCLKQCSTFEEQEQCIDAFNALVEVKEDFILRNGMVSRAFLFLLFVLLLQLTQIYGPIGWLKRGNQLAIIPITVLMYYLIHYLL